MTPEHARLVRCINQALIEHGAVMTLDDLISLARERKAQIWSEGNAIAVTQILAFPQRKVLDSAFFRRAVLDPEDVARHIADRVGEPPGETTIPRWYRAPGILQAAAPNLAARLIARRAGMYRRT